MNEESDRRLQEYQDRDSRLQLLMDVREALGAGIEAMLDLPKAQDDARYWREKYQELLNESISHGRAMMGNVLSALLEPEKYAGKRR